MRDPIDKLVSLQGSSAIGGCSLDDDIAAYLDQKCCENPEGCCDPYPEDREEPRQSVRRLYENSDPRPKT
ncbi:hypothetical protein [Ruegeria arenilitoris]|uniref:hypothetical protein n=1 Tax=Ruegeria arenilitoris TaxID=1173585 RepID=UPI001479FB62|nr:hypothetical protein [Ruegeria arenilitoris]